MVSADETVTHSDWGHIPSIVFATDQTESEVDEAQSSSTLESHGEIRPRAMIGRGTRSVGRL
jgi:hypothetical protein